jgi:transcriptional regulator with XRE-family HTH domain
MFDLQRYRLDNKLKQSDVVRLTGLNQAIVSKYENNIGVTDYLTSVLADKLEGIDAYKIHRTEKFDPMRELLMQQRDLVASITTLTESNKLLISILSNPKKSQTADHNLAVEDSPVYRK